MLKLTEVMRANSSLYVLWNLIDKAGGGKKGAVFYILNFTGQT